MRKQPMTHYARKLKTLYNRNADSDEVDEIEEGNFEAVVRTKAGVEITLKSHILGGARTSATYRGQDVSDAMLSFIHDNERDSPSGSWFKEDPA